MKSARLADALERLVERSSVEHSDREHYVILDVFHGALAVRNYSLTQTDAA